jgi:hypothetical protein
MGRCLFRCRNGMVIIDSEALRYSHTVTNISGHGDPAHAVRPRIHRAVSLIGRWWPGLHQGANRLSHLEFYLDEFPFNRRGSRVRSLFVYRLKKKDVGSVFVSRQMILRDRPRPLVDDWVDYIWAKIKKATLLLSWQLGYVPRGYFL